MSIMDVLNFRAFVVSIAVEDVRGGLYGAVLESMKTHMTALWDSGAWRTLWRYYDERSNTDLKTFLSEYFVRYYRPLQSGWVVVNPSAAVVALCRELA